MKCEFKDQAMIYISGWGVWGRVLEQTDEKVELYIEGSPIQWFSKKEILSLMNQDEPSTCDE